MYKNNYTKNSEGLSVSVSAYYDSVMASVLFRENFEHLNRDCTLFFYTEEGTYDTPKYIKDVADITEKGKEEEIEDYPLEELEYFIEQGYCTMKEPYLLTHVHGYSQGDYATVLHRSGDKEEFERLFYEAPMYIQATVEEECYDIYYSGIDPYDPYDKEKIAKAFNDLSKYKSEELFNEFLRLLPETLPYE